MQVPRTTVSERGQPKVVFRQTLGYPIQGNARSSDSKGAPIPDRSIFYPCRKNRFIAQRCQRGDNLSVGFHIQNSISLTIAMLPRII